ncbi:MAG: FtsW/RodA/SpoVE family cell cycle protein [Thermoleophilaceae bacterium]|nr:FtsW/RodA/SpoVE family cell cycle protein [Thermoleophilaceae bacterium]
MALLVTAGFAAVLEADGNQINDATITYGAVFLGLCLVGHLFIRARLPHADPYLYPIAALLSAVGIVMIYRIDQELARQQAQWFVLGLIVFCLTVLFLRDVDRLKQYRYTIAASAIGLLLLPRIIGFLTGGANLTNGAYLTIDIGPVAFQPAEIAKLGIVVFVAAYLADTRGMLVRHERRFLGIAFPPLRYFGPMFLVWALSMVMLVVIRDLGSSVMFFGVFLALLFVATNRASYAWLGLLMFVLGFIFVSHTVGHVDARLAAWQHPFVREIYDADGGSYQIAQSMFAQADGGVFGVGLGNSLLGTPTHRILPLPENDMIFAVVVSELGLAGGAALLLAYMLFAMRGFKAAMVASDPFVKLLATGLSTVFALQVFVIVGGVTRVIPLTGVTLPWVAYGGSSIIANFILLALLMIVSNQARRPETAAIEGTQR